MLFQVQMLGAWEPNVRAKQFVTGFFQKLVMPAMNISHVDAGVLAFSNLLCLDVSRNNLVRRGMIHAGFDFGENR